MAKTAKKDSTYIDDPQRCEICETTLTLYPKDFNECPHCRRKICRQCWGATWAAKAFSADNCAHLIENEGLTINPVGESKKGFRFDWPRAIFTVVLSALAIGILFFLLNLFIL